jgi:hypothetical protein
MPSLQTSRSANLGNQAIVDNDTPVLDQGQTIVLSDQRSIPDQQHGRYLHCADSSEGIPARFILHITLWHVKADYNLYQAGLDTLNFFWDELSAVWRAPATLSNGGCAILDNSN